MDARTRRLSIRRSAPPTPSASRSRAFRHRPRQAARGSNPFAPHAPLAGSNASGIDTALYAKKRGLTVIAITAKSNAGKPATHSSGKRLPHAADIVIDTGSPVEDAIVDIKGWSRPVAGSSTVLAMMMMHELLAESAQKLADRGIELPVFASPTIPGVTLHDTDIIYGQYRERMIEAQQKHLPQFKKSMAKED